MTPPLRVGLWAAVSSGPQAADDKVSIEDQMAAGERFVQTVAGVVVSRYTVPGHSRDYVFWHEAEDAMPAYRAVREDIEGTRVDVIHCVSSDRLGRDPALVQQFYSLASRHGVQIYDASAPMPLGEMTMSHRLVPAIRSVLAGQELAALVERHKMGMRGRVLKRGLHPGVPPFGYEVVRDEAGRAVAYVQTPGAETVRALTRLYLAGLPYSAIAIAANGDGYRRRDGRPWTPSEVRRILTNDSYAGLFRWGAAHLDAPSPHVAPVWDGATFAAVVAERRRRARGPYNRAGSGPYVGVAFCRRCGARMVSYNGEAHRVWRCGTHLHRQETGRTCHANGIAEWKITVQVASYLSQFVTPEAVDLALGELPGDAADSLRADIDRASRAAADLERQRERLGHNLAGGFLDGSMYRTLDDELLARLDAERRRVTDLTAMLAALPDLAQRRADLLEVAGHFADLVADCPPAEIATALQRIGLRVEVEDNAVQVVRIA